MEKLLKPELSKANPYWIERHRYYELKHFCLQYNYWVEQLNSIDYIPSPRIDSPVEKYGPFKPVESITERREKYKTNIELVQKASVMTDNLLSGYLFEHVTKGLTYEKLNAKKRIPCNREEYYRLYRRFFWILSMLKD